MRILHLNLTNFRNYSRLELDFPSGVVVLQGDNAQGKTNLLEAMCCLSRMSSPRTSADREWINWLALEDDLPFCRLVAQVEGNQGTDQVELSLVQNHLSNLEENGSGLRKHIRVNGANKRALDAVGVLSVVLFLPQDIELVDGSPSLRRRYLDDTISQVDARYRRELQRYSQVVSRRNYLLKSMRGRSFDPAELVFWDNRMVEHGAYLVLRRQSVIQQLDELVQQLHAQLTNAGERLRLEYVAGVRLNGRPDAGRQLTLPGEMLELPEVTARFAEELRGAHKKDLDSGVSTVGPHRDDLRFLANSVDMNVYGSRGQQRTVALSLKLAEVELITRAREDRPVLLLDDVMSELDAAHRAALFATVDQAQQVVMTATDVVHYPAEFLARAAVWSVCAGVVSAAGGNSSPRG